MWAGLAGADDHVELAVERAAVELGDALVGIGAVGVGDGDEIAGRGGDAGLERGAVATVDAMADDTDTVAGNGREKVGGAVVAAVVDEDDLGGRQGGAQRRQPSGGGHDGALFVVDGDDY